MSIKSMCRGDTVFKNTFTHGAGALSNKGGTWSSDSGSGLACRVEDLSASDIAKYDARGLSVTHRVYFSTDPVLSVNSSRLHWTKTDGNRTTVDKYLRITGEEHENNPRGRLVLFVFTANYEAERRGA